MCGLFGMAGNGVVKQDLSALDDLMLVSSTRGDDGTGLAAGRDGRGKIFKETGDPFYWRCLITKQQDQLMSINNNWFIGHTRSATTGAISKAAAQPFFLKNIVGTHNGTIPWEYAPFNTDSEKLLSIIDARGNDALVDIVSSIPSVGAYALVWYDFKTSTLNFLRNKMRPLWVAKNTERSVIYWASEERMLEFALTNMKYKVWYFSEDVHYSIKVNQIERGAKLEFAVEDIKPIKKVELVEKPDICLLQDGTAMDVRTGRIIPETEDDLLDIPWIRNTRSKKVSVH